ncbi:MAG: 2-amino-4-hydroxy-6-hydroxymethyldihydropteridine diphosphokinase [Actinomycetales bacterium]
MTPSREPTGPVPVVLAIGSNLGDRDANLTGAVAALNAVPGLQVLGRSQVVETDPVGGPAGQPTYLNAVLQCACELSAMELLWACQEIEAQFDRSRVVRWGPRTLDIDIITYGELVDDDERLTVPHPRAHERAFVLVPWAQLDPDAHLPGPQGGSVATLAAAANDRLGVRPHRRPRRRRMS